MESKTNSKPTVDEIFSNAFRSNKRYVEAK